MSSGQPKICGTTANSGSDSATTKASKGDAVKPIYERDYIKLTHNTQIEGIRVNHEGIWPDSNAYLLEHESRNFPPDKCHELLKKNFTAAEIYALLEHPEGWIPGKPFVSFPCSLEQLIHGLGIYADAIDLDIAFEYQNQDRITADKIKAPPKAWIFQEELILKTLVDLNFDPDNLPDRDRKNRGRGPKSAVKEKLLRDTKVFTNKSFEKAWERLRSQNRITGAR